MDLCIMQNEQLKVRIERVRNQQIDILESANVVLHKIVALTMHENKQLGIKNHFLDERGDIVRNKKLTENMFGEMPHSPRRKSPNLRDLAAKNETPV